MKNLPSELCWAFLDEQWVNSMMAKIDLNGDGGISVEEFVELNMRLVKYIKKEVAVEAFNLSTWSKKS